MAPPGVSLIEVRPLLLEASRLGFTPAEVLDIVAALRTGIVVGETWDGPVRIPIRLRLAHEADAFTLPEVQIATPSGEVVALSQVAEIDHLETPALVSRDRGQRRIIVGFNVRDAELGDVVEAAQAAADSKIDRDELGAAGIHFEWGGQYEQLEEARARLAVVVPIVLISVLAVLIAVFRRLRPAADHLLERAVRGGRRGRWRCGAEGCRSRSRPRSGSSRCRASRCSTASS